MINSAYRSLEFWDGSAPSLEGQAKGADRQSLEMASTHDVAKRLQADPKYVARFMQAWGTEGITIDRGLKSIAWFGSVRWGNSPFDDAAAAT